jgi:hypothetical protein
MIASIANSDESGARRAWYGQEMIPRLDRQ